MKKQLLITAIILGTLIVAVATPDITAAANHIDDGTIRASSFQYDANMPAIHGQRLVYDPTAPAVRGMSFGY